MSTKAESLTEACCKQTPSNKFFVLPSRGSSPSTHRDPPPLYSWQFHCICACVDWVHSSILLLTAISRIMLFIPWNMYVKLSLANAYKQKFKDIKFDKFRANVTTELNLYSLHHNTSTLFLFYSISPPHGTFPSERIVIVSHSKLVTFLLR